MPKLELTDKTIKAAKVSEGTRKLDLFDTLARGLCIRVGAGGVKTFYFVYSDASGKRVWNKLGEYGEHTGQFTLAAARKQAKELRGYVAGGNDPAAEKRSERAALTVLTWSRIISPAPLPAAAPLTRSHAVYERTSAAKIQKATPCRR
ncbi:DUF4102 domain-containing protein [Ochrobactrum anthropi ATCC 49188]|nr:DUF4102 domain-containing protein [Brucella anthropi ATCC 49188]